MDQTLLKAARSGDIDVIKQLADDAEGNILGGGTTPQGNTALHVVARFGHENLAREIMKRQPNLLLKTNLKGENPVHVAARGGHWKIVVLFKDSLKDSTDVYIARIKDSTDVLQHLTLKALKTAFAKRAINPKDVVDNAEISNVGLGLGVERGGKKSREMAQIISVMATLIATCTFTAAFTLPGGFINEGPDAGMATLIKKSAFRAFVITDTIAMTSSITAAVMVFWSSSSHNSELVMDSLPFAIGLTWIALVAMALAFVTGLFVVLSKTLWLGIVVCLIGCAAPAILYIFAPLFLLVFDRLSSRRARHIVGDNPLSFVFRLAKMIS